jgi:pantoate--beta-alanine ligase
MLVVRKIKEIIILVAEEKLKGKKIGFVPTMGALHPGHISLIEISRKQTDFTICSIFVNPTQFNNASDLTHYPRTPEKDIELLKSASCDLLYMPDVNDVYPEKDVREFDFGYLDTILEAAHRPGHFNGVAQVVSILLKNIQPDLAFFGSKDYQQVMIVKSLVKQLNLNTEIVACPILREADGLAMSSRNMRLTGEERKIAAQIPKWMQEAVLIIKNEGVDAAKRFVLQKVDQVPEMKLDYYEVCEAETLMPLKHLSPGKNAVSLIAVFVSKIRLIDNWMIN